jgi:hypothetical protein
VGELGEDRVEAAVALLGTPPVALDPGRHEVEHLGLEVGGPLPPLPPAADDPGVLEDPEVLGDRLDGDLVRLGERRQRRGGLG